MTVKPIAVVVGTRPELIKMAPILCALMENEVPFRFIHTGQHYDENMSEVFLRELNLPPVDEFLAIGGGSHAHQTAKGLIQLEQFLLTEPCKAVLVQGDTNTVLAGALVGAKLGVPVGHVEAGLRSHDARMPEEYNRRIADHISSELFAPTSASAEILHQERVMGRVHLTGNTVIDAVNRYAPEAIRRSQIPTPSLPFILATTHRAENVDDASVLRQFVEVFLRSPLPVVLPVHPRTGSRLKSSGLYEKLQSADHIHLLPPVGYLDFLALMQRSRMVITDSGGIQEEATAPALRKRVLVLRNSTERPEAVASGFATVVGTNAGDILNAISDELDSPVRLPSTSPYGNGDAAARIVEIMRAL